MLLRTRKNRRRPRFGARPAGAALAALVACVAATGRGAQARAQTAAPALVDANLRIRTLATGLNQPTTMAFLGANDFLVLEKATGQVKCVVGGVVQPAPVLDLAVNNGSERGLLGVVLHPDFAQTPYVYLYWTWRGREWYERQIRQTVETPDNFGRRLIINIESGEYEVDDDSLAATHRLLARNPDAQLFGMKIGFPAASKRGGSWPATVKK